MYMRIIWGRLRPGQWEPYEAAYKRVLGPHRERLFDMAAADLGIDRVEFRRRNLVAPNEMPWDLPNVVPRTWI